MIKRITSLTVILAILSAILFTFSVPSLAVESTGNEIFDSFISDPRWADGGIWGSKGPDISPYRGYQCCAYCCDFVQYCFGISDPRGGIEFTDINEIRAGDVVTVGNQGNGYGHWFCVLNRIGDDLYTAEGNYAGVIRIGWNYKIVGDEIQGASYAFNCGYHFLGDITNPPTEPIVSISKRIFDTGETVTLSWTACRNAEYYIVSCRKGNERFIYEDCYTLSRELSFVSNGEYSITVIAVNSCGKAIGNRIRFTVNLPALPSRNPWYYNSNLYDADYDETDFSDGAIVPNSPSFNPDAPITEEKSLACELKMQTEHSYFPLNNQ